MSFVISHPDINEAAVIPERALANYAARGWLLVEQIDGTSTPAEASTLKQPGKNGSAPEWRTYAVATGDMTLTEAFDKTRDEIVEHYHPTPAPKTATAVKTIQES